MKTFFMLRGRRKFIIAGLTGFLTTFLIHPVASVLAVDKQIDRRTYSDTIENQYYLVFCARGGSPTGHAFIIWGVEDNNKLISAPNSLDLNQENLAFCSEIRDERLRDIAREESTKKQATRGGVSITNLSGKGSHSYERSSGSYNEHRMSEYYSKNCDKLLEAHSQISIAQINANKEVAIAEIQSNRDKYTARLQSEDFRYGQNTQRRIEEGKNRANVTTSIAGTASNLISNVVSANVERKKLALERKRLDVELEIARLNADPNLALLQNWGLKRTSCNGSVVSILIDGKEYCAKPVKGLSVGNYAYIRAEDRLEPISESPNPLNANNSNPQPSPEQVPQSPNLVNTNTNSNPQPTPETGL
ncbi:hypothetical protein WA1_24475 [Scytonema hofmannii PCC 7110]|uniref:Uncharacterized protein n=1 Tax=Scytonema hofmannii PCC 7110 TaxID=128403 RepID=A0A139X7Y2_9CYAN|nr:hypothetical protein [Scytonema hofmannii]KYC40786.1 hypothetical protein WA1_24475 [Scytonema hofmannii PCC 7110]